MRQGLTVRPEWEWSNDSDLVGRGPGMERCIVGFHQDPEGHWVAELECGHNQHVRHDPPWQVRPWVLVESIRRTHLGTALSCVLCDRNAAAGEVQDSAGLSPSQLELYRDARLRGLCHEGALEVARGRTGGLIDRR